MSYSCNYAFYDENKVYISGTNSQADGIPFTSPSNGYYIRFSNSSWSGEWTKNIKLHYYESSTSPTDFGQNIVIENVSYDHDKTIYKGAVRTLIEGLQVKYQIMI